jgi:hypothetical protein
MDSDLLRRVSAFLVFMAAVLFGPVVFAQAAENAGAPIAQGTSSEWGGALMWAFFSSSVLEWLKRSPKLTLFAESTAFWAQRITGVVVAAAAAMGVHYTFDPQAGVLTITGLSVAAIWTAAVETARQFCVQELLYRVAVKDYHASLGRQ